MPQPACCHLEDEDTFFLLFPHTFSEGVASWKEQPNQCPSHHRAGAQLISVLSEQSLSEPERPRKTRTKTLPFPLPHLSFLPSQSP